MAPIGDRVREWIWAHPGKARMAVAGAVLTAVAAGAFVAVRPDGDGASGRERHRQYAGATEADDGLAGDQLDAPNESTAPAGADGAAAAGGPAGSPGTATTSAGAPTPAGGTGTAITGPGSGVAVGGSSTATIPGGPNSTQPGPGTTKTTGPTGGTRTGTPVTATAAAPGWGLLPKAPIGPRTDHTAVWTGREVVIWGGTSDFEAEPLTDGAAYDPAARTWRKLPGAPLAPRYGAGAFWTGTEMLVFGGAVDGDIVADGAAWDTATNTWRAIPASPLGLRDGYVATWAGDRLVIWSGNTVPGPDASTDSSGDTPEPPGDAPEVRNDGAAYVPATNSWVPIGPAPIPGRSGAQSAWTGSRLIVTGGEGVDDDRTDGAALDPVSGVWSPIATRPQPGSCGGDTACSGLWTGTAVLFPASSLAYDPAADRWSAMAAPPGAEAPTPGEPAVWTGQRLLTWGVPGGDDDGSVDDAGDGPALPAAAMYDPATNRWQKVPAGPLKGRSFHAVVWTGEALVIWGGQDDDANVLADGAAYRPE